MTIMITLFILCISLRLCKKQMSQPELVSFLNLSSLPLFLPILFVPWSKPVITGTIITIIINISSRSSPCFADLGRIKYTLRYWALSEGKFFKIFSLQRVIHVREVLDQKFLGLVDLPADGSPDSGASIKPRKAHWTFQPCAFWRN